MEVRKMRELTMDELGEVSGGNIADAAKYWGSAAVLAQGVFGSGWASMAAVSALGVSPIGLLGIGILTVAGGYQVFR